MSIIRKSALLSNNFLGRSLTFILLAIGLSVPTMVNAAQCPAGYINTRLNASDYQKWKDGNQNVTIDVTGDPNISNSGLQLQGNVTQNSNVQQFYGTSGYRFPPGVLGGFFFSQSFKNKTNVTPQNTAIFTFNKPINNLQFSIYDIDARDLLDNQWLDEVQLIARDSNNKILPVKFKDYNTYYIEETANDTIKAKRIYNCDDRSTYDSRCTATANFTGSVKTLEVVYTNILPISYGGRHTNQYIVMTFDSFCAEDPNFNPPTIKVVKKLPNGVAAPDNRFTFNLYEDQEQPSNSLVDGNTRPNQTNGIFDIFDHKIKNRNFASHTYIIKEAPFSGTNTNLSDYNTNYQCIDERKGVTDPERMVKQGNGAKIVLDNLKENQQVICTFTNTPTMYTFSGIIFNDNGGITDPKADDISNKYTGNEYYFNGQYDPDYGEEGISVTEGNDLKVQLVNCDNNKPLTNQNFTLNDNGETGRYKITIPRNQITPGEVCLLQKEPESWQDPSNSDAYSVDTTANKIKLSVSNSQSNYPDNNFGEVKQINAALVLTKRQYVNSNCRKDLTALSTNDTASPNTAYSKQTAANIEPNQCMAYQLEAFNRAHVDLTDVTVKDILQKKGLDGSQITLKFDSSVTPSADPQYSSMTVNTDKTDDNGRQIVEFSSFDLPKHNRKRKLYFNTVYSNED